MPYRRVYILLGDVPSQLTALGSVNSLWSSSGPYDSACLQAIQCSMNSDVVGLVLAEDLVRDLDSCRWELSASRAGEEEARGKGTHQAERDRGSDSLRRRTAAAAAIYSHFHTATEA